MKSNLEWIPLGGLFATVVASVYMVVQLDAQTPAMADLTNASMVQVRDAQGQVVLQGQFAEAVEEDGDRERRATLTATGVNADAAGEAEVEFSETASTTQEVEFSVKNLPAGASFTFVVDGVDIATATTDRRGRAEVELNVETPGRE